MPRRREAPAFNKSPPVVPAWPLTKADASRSSHMVTNEASERVTSINDSGEMLVRVRLSGFAWCSLVDKTLCTCSTFSSFKYW